jgi:hypothetical protein
MELILISTSIMASLALMHVLGPQILYLFQNICVKAVKKQPKMVYIIFGGTIALDVILVVVFYNIFYNILKKIF